MAGMPVEIPSDLAQFLRQSNSVVALTGAGISAESGVPTFRDAQTGLWARYNPQDLATPQAFRRDPRLVWEWYALRRQLVARARPNPGHFALAEMENRLPRFTLITQNVDGLHAQAGSRAVLELHGNIQRTKCFQDGELVYGWEETGEIPPRCPRCGAYLRPDVVWFGEALPAPTLDAAVQAAVTCQVFLAIGTSGIVQPAASLPLMALDRGAVVVEINPDETPLTPYVNYLLAGPSGVVLPELVRSVWG